MKVIFKTNIDFYNEVDAFPKKFDACPSIGHKVHVRKDFKSYFNDKRLPSYLEVVAINWLEDEETDLEKYRTVAIVELHYDELTIRASKVTGVKLF